MEMIKTKRVFALAGIILLVLGTWLPYYEVNVFGIVSRVSAWGYWEGKIILVITLANALFIFKDFIEKYVPQLFQTNVGKMVEKASAPKASLIPTVLIVAFLVYMYIRINARSNEFITNGLGFYALWLGAICLVVHAFVYKPTTANVIPQQPQPMGNPNQGNPFATQVTQNQPQGTNFQNPVGAPGKKYCPKCGNQVDESASFCFMCGNKF